MPQLTCKFALGERVNVDADKSIIAVIISVEWKRPDVVCYETSWLHNGDAKFIFFDEWRLTPCG